MLQQGDFKKGVQLINVQFVPLLLAFDAGGKKREKGERR